VVSFALMPQGSAQEAGAAKGAAAPELAGSLKKTPYLDSWIRIDADGTVTVFTGKCEFGQGIRTALMQVAAEELDVAFDRLKLVTADTA
jgi:nicotinate dehydrogenase subunit B